MEGISEARLLSLFGGESLDWLQIEVEIQMQVVQVLTVNQQVQHVVTLGFKKFWVGKRLTRGVALIIVRELGVLLPVLQFLSVPPLPVTTTKRGFRKIWSCNWPRGIFLGFT